MMKVMTETKATVSTSSLPFLCVHCLVRGGSARFTVLRRDTSFQQNSLAGLNVFVIDVISAEVIFNLSAPSPYWLLFWGML